MSETVLMQWPVGQHLPTNLPSFYHLSDHYPVVVSNREVHTALQYGISISEWMTWNISYEAEWNKCSTYAKTA